MTTETWAAHSLGAEVSEFTAFYRDYQPRVIRYCYRLVRDEQAAFDLAQEAFARLFTRWVAVREPDAYLFHVATNLARAAYAKRLRDDAAAVLVRDVSYTQDSHVDLHLALDRLPRRYREVVLLYYFADLPVAEVARVVRRPGGTVMRQLAEARALLARRLEVADHAR